MSQAISTNSPPLKYGHPPGLFSLFFVEMWERFSYYGMRALLLLYMVKGFLGYNDKQAYGVYAAYGALVYATPFIGGMLADRILGARAAVILGGLLMAMGHLSMSIEQDFFFFLGLGLLVVGNGLFKPNISTIVGGLYHDLPATKRDGGFTIFYMGINLGAAMSPLLCGYVGETYGWHYGFGIATIGMLVGLASFMVPNLIARFLILFSAGAAAIGLFVSGTTGLTLLINAIIAVALLFAGYIAFSALGVAGVPRELGAAPKSANGAFSAKGYIIALIGALIVAVFVQMLLHPDAVKIAAYDALVEQAKTDASVGAFSTMLAYIIAYPAKTIMFVLGGSAITYLIVQTFKLPHVARMRLIVALILMFFTTLFWSFFEQAGSSMSLYTDRNVDRVMTSQVVTEADVGKSLTLELSQAQVGYVVEGETVLSLARLDQLREEARAQREATKSLKPVVPTATITVTPAHVGMKLGEASDELNTSIFQAVNPVFILTLGMLLTMLWTWLSRRRLEPNVPVKFAIGIALLGAGFYAMVLGAQAADARGMVGVSWLLLAYFLHTTGELCISPVGLSMVTRLTPKRLVSTVMGAWFLSSAFAYILGGWISSLTAVQDVEGVSASLPLQTLPIYTEVFSTVGMTALIAAGVLLVISPLLSKWMYPNEPDEIPGA